MACISVGIKSSILGRSTITVNSLVANTSGITHISEPLAKKIGLTEFSDVYLNASFGGLFKGKISKFPMIILKNDKTVYCYPVVIPNAFNAMIIGVDCLNQCADLLNMAIGNNLKPTPGPRYEEDAISMGHMVHFADHKMVLEGKERAEFLEYPCLNSEALDRLAVHWESNQIAAQYTDSNTVYRYKNVDYEVLGKIANGEVSRGKILNDVKNAGHKFTQSTLFPKSMLMLPNHKPQFTISFGN